MNSRELILQKQQEIEFNATAHTYLYNGKYLTNGTNYIKQFYKPFNKEEILEKVSKSDLQLKAKKRYEWDNSSVYGSYIHELLELYYNDYEVTITNEYGEEHQFNQGINLVEEILRTGDIEIVGTEVMITNGEIAGTIDLLLYNNETNKFILCDYKTCDKMPLNSFNGEKMKAPFDIDDCKFEKYCLQLSLYSAILEMNYEGVEVEACYILWIPKNGNGVIKRAFDYKNIFKELLK